VAIELSELFRRGFPQQVLDFLPKHFRIVVETLREEQVTRRDLQDFADFVDNFARRPLDASGFDSGNVIRLLANPIFYILLTEVFGLSQNPESFPQQLGCIDSHPAQTLVWKSV